MSIAAMLAFSIGLIFWGGQRYPSLLKKLHTGNSVHVGGPITFEVLLQVQPQMPVPQRIARTTVNWLWANRFGMYFALPFGAATMTLLAQIRRPKQFSNAAANVICGAVAGAPLGVCANCATPIGQGLLLSGASTRLTVATMISSPSFNPIVVAIAFVLFPWRLAAMRVIAPLLILLVLPLLVREKTTIPEIISLDKWEKPVGNRLKEIALAFLRNLFRLTILTLPWMVLAALIGGFTTEMIPVYGTRLPVSILGVCFVAALGTLLPVPMAFDVVLAWVLYHAGIPACYVVALLCTLGPVSAYSLFALGQQLGSTVPLRLAIATTSLGSLAGWLLL